MGMYPTGVAAGGTDWNSQAWRESPVPRARKLLLCRLHDHLLADEVSPTQIIWNNALYLKPTDEGY